VRATRSELLELAGRRPARGCGQRPPAAAAAQRWTPGGERRGRAGSGAAAVAQAAPAQGHAVDYIIDTSARLPGEIHPDRHRAPPDQHDLAVRREAPATAGSPESCSWGGSRGGATSPGRRVKSPRIRRPPRSSSRQADGHHGRPGVDAAARRVDVRDRMTRWAGSARTWLLPACSGYRGEDAQDAGRPDGNTKVARCLVSGRGMLGCDPARSGCETAGGSLPGWTVTESAGCRWPQTHWWPCVGACRVMGPGCWVPTQRFPAANWACRVFRPRARPWAGLPARRGSVGLTVTRVAAGGVGVGRPGRGLRQPQRGARYTPGMEPFKSDGQALPAAAIVRCF